MSAVIEFLSVSKMYRAHRRAAPREILNDFTFRIEPGELVAFVGPSGVGKSTLLHVAAKIVTPDRGEMKQVSLKATGARLGMVFQDPRLLPWLTVEQNIRVAVKAAGLDDRNIPHLLQQVGLDTHSAAFPLTLSGGQRQRAALSRAFAVQPDILLLDEPFSALDEVTAHRLRALLQNLLNVHETTAILVTHNLEEAAFLADRIVVLDGPPVRVKDIVTVAIPRPRRFDDPEILTLRHDLSERVTNTDAVA